MTSPRWDKLGDVYRRGVDEPLSAERGQSQRERLALDYAMEQQLGHQDAPARRWWHWGLGVALAAAVAAVLAVLWFPPRARELDCHTDAGQRIAQGAQLSSEAGPLELRFGDGSRLQLASHSSLVAKQLRDTEVELVLKEGRLAAEVQKSATRVWRYRAGPYQVRVLGTSLQISWQPQSKQLVVGVTKGLVSVRGGSLSGPGQQVSAGQQLHVQRGVVRLKREQAEPGVTKPDVQPIPESQPVARRDTRPPGVTPAPSRRWRKLLAEGRHEAAWQAAQKAGLRPLRRRARADELLALADLARVVGKPRAAAQTLKTVRRRFKGSRSAALAAFELGRLAATRGDHRSAAGLFQRYLTETPKGKRAADALGRLMASLHRLGQNEAAKNSARSYLERYPKGTYAPLAKTLLSEPSK